VTDFSGIRGEVMVDGHRLETLTYPAANGQRPTIVMLHEGLGSVSLWRDFPARLAAATLFRVSPSPSSRFRLQKVDPEVDEHASPRELYEHDKDGQNEAG